MTLSDSNLSTAHIKCQGASSEISFSCAERSTDQEHPRRCRLFRESCRSKSSVCWRSSRDGKTVRLNSHYRDVDGLFEVIQAAVFERLLPKAREALEAGRSDLAPCG